MGVGFYGRSFTLLIHLALAPAAPLSQEGTPGHVLMPPEFCPIKASQS